MAKLDLVSIFKLYFFLFGLIIIPILISLYMILFGLISILISSYFSYLAVIKAPISDHLIFEMFPGRLVSRSPRLDVLRGNIDWASMLRA